jgi:hypothetical protein
MDGLFKKVQKAAYNKIPSKFSEELNDFIGACLTLNPKNRPSCEDLLEMTAIKKRLALDPYCEAESSTPMDDLLLNTIKFPKNFKQLSALLPKPKHVSNQPPQPAATNQTPTGPTHERSSNSTSKKRTQMSVSNEGSEKEIEISSQSALITAVGSESLIASRKNSIVVPAPPKKAEPQSSTPTSVNVCKPPSILLQHHGPQSSTPPASYSVLQNVLKQQIPQAPVAPQQPPIQDANQYRKHRALLRRDIDRDRSANNIRRSQDLFDEITKLDLSRGESRGHHVRAKTPPPAYSILTRDNSKSSAYIRQAREFRQLTPISDAPLIPSAINPPEIKRRKDNQSAMNLSMLKQQLNSYVDKRLEQLLLRQHNSSNKYNQVNIPMPGNDRSIMNNVSICNGSNKGDVSMKDIYQIISEQKGRAYQKHYCSHDIENIQHHQVQGPSSNASALGSQMQGAGGIVYTIPSEHQLSSQIEVRPSGSYVPKKFLV